MSDNKQTTVEAELDALRKRSGELIAEVERISRRINQLSGRVEQSSAAPTDPAITDTWVDAKPLDSPRSGRAPEEPPYTCGNKPVSLHPPAMDGRYDPFHRAAPQ